MYKNYNLFFQLLLILLFLIFSSLNCAENKDEKWIWDNNKERNGRKLTPNYKTFGDFFNNDYDSDYSDTYNPLYNQHYYGNRPSTNNYYNHRPIGGSTGGGLYNHRPDGGSYGQNRPGILTGPVPSWTRDDENFDKCKCTEKFNCPTPGISYGHCDVGKKYCCYSSGRDRFRDDGSIIHDPSLGILVGPNGRKNFKN